MADQTRVGTRVSRGADSSGGAGSDGNGKGRGTSSTSAASPGSADSISVDEGMSDSSAAPTVAPEAAPTAPTTGAAPARTGQSTKAESVAGDSGAASPLTASLQRLTRSRGQIRARKVHRIVRRVDPWSVLKLSLIFYLCVWVMVIVAVVLMWGVAVGSGAVASVENFIAEFLAFEQFSFNGDQLFQIFALGGLIGVFVATAVTAVLAVLFNLIADLTGGVRFTVIEEESARRVLPRDSSSAAQHGH